MLTKDMRLKVIAALQSGKVSLNQLIFILKIYYMRDSFTEEEINIITTMYNKVRNGELTSANYMDFFYGLGGVKRTGRDDTVSGVVDLIKHRDELEKIK